MLGRLKMSYTCCYAEETQGQKPTPIFKFEMRDRFQRRCFRILITDFRAPNRRKQTRVTRLTAKHSLRIFFITIAANEIRLEKQTTSVFISLC